MSEIEITTGQTDTRWSPGQIPPAIHQQLASLRRALTQGLWVSGAAKMVLIGLAVLLVDFLLDYFFHMDQSQRMIMGGLMVASFFYAAYHFLWRPLSARVSDDALLLSVERHLGPRHNELINSLQLAREADLEARGYSSELAAQAIRQGAAMAAELDFSQALDRSSAARRRGWLAGGLTGLAVLSLVVVGTEVGWLWFQRNLLLANQPWPTRTRLEVQGLVDGALLVPRGEDHRLVVKVDPDSRDVDVEVFLDFVGRSSATRQKLRVDAEDSLSHTTTLRGVNSEFTFQVRGGDFVSDPIPVILVQPPGFERLKLTVLPPPYSGLDEITLPLSAENYKVLLGSQVVIQAKADQSPVDLALLRGEQRWEIPQGPDGEFRFVLTGPDLKSGRYQFDLSDERGVRGGRPVQFSLDVVPDRPPQIRTRYFGVTSLVVPQAMIPVTISIEDEFLITDAWAELVWESETEEVRGQHRQPLDQIGELREGNQLSGNQIFDLLPLDIPSGLVLNLTVKARDNQPEVPLDSPTLPDPTEAQEAGAAATAKPEAKPVDPALGVGKAMVFRVVTEAELRSDLLPREVEQTKTFERLIAQQQAIVTELLAMQASQQQRTETRESFLIRQTQMADKSVRNQHQVGTLLAQITDRFRGFLAEVRNNRLDLSSAEIDGGQGLAVRLDQQIIRPLNEIEQQLLPALDRAMELVSRSVGDAAQLDQSIEQVLPQLNEVLRRLNEVLDAMQRSQSFQEIVNMVISIKNEEQRLKKLAEEKKRAESGLDEIFDD